MFIITFIGIVILNGITSSVSDTTLSNAKKIFTVPQSGQKLNETLHLSEMQRLSQIKLLFENNITVCTSRFEASWTSMMNALEKIQRIIDDLRSLVETLHQMTQTFIDVVNKLSRWIDQVNIDPSFLSSV